MELKVFEATDLIRCFLTASVYCEAAGTFLTGLVIKHKTSVQEVLSGRPFGSGVLVRHFYWPPVYSNINKQKKPKKPYGEEVMLVSVDPVLI